MSSNRQPEWLRRLQARRAEAEAARIRWYLRRHHCWDPARKETDS